LQKHISLYIDSNNNFNRRITRTTKKEMSKDEEYDYLFKSMFLF